MEIENEKIKKIADSIVYNYLVNGDYEKLPDDIMYEVYSYLNNVNLNIYKSSIEGFEEKETSSRVILLLLSAISGSCSAITASFLLSNINLLACAISASLIFMGVYNFAHVKRFKHNINRLLNDISNEYCFLAPEYYKKIEKQRKLAVCNEKSINLKQGKKEENTQNNNINIDNLSNEFNEEDFAFTNNEEDYSTLEFDTKNSEKSVDNDIKIRVKAKYNLKKN